MALQAHSQEKLQDASICKAALPDGLRLRAVQVPGAAPPDLAKALQAHLQEKFQDASICKASVPDGLRKRIQERLLRDLRPDAEGAAVAVTAGVAVMEGLRHLQKPADLKPDGSAGAGASLAFAPNRGRYNMGGRGGRGGIRSVPLPMAATHWQPPRAADGLVDVQSLDVQPFQMNAEEVLSDPAVFEADVPEELQPKAPELVYSRGFRHGFASAAIGDIAQPLQETLLDPYLRPNAEDTPRATAAYDWGTLMGRMWLADRGARALLTGIGANGMTGGIGFFLGEVAYKAAKSLVMGGKRGSSEDDAAAGPPSTQGGSSPGQSAEPLATIIYDEKCSVCLEELMPGGIVVLVHGTSGHACVCDGCFGQAGVRTALQSCPLCRQDVTDYVPA